MTNILQSTPEVYELIAQQKSQWIKRGTENTGNPIHLSSCATYALPMKSRFYKGAGNGFVETQYVIDAPTIFVNDYVDDSGEAKKGLKSLGYDLKEEYRRSSSLNICFKFGKLDLKTYGDDPQLREYINYHESNIKAPNYSLQARRGRMFNFQPLQQEARATKRIDTLEVKQLALTEVLKLRTKTGKDYTYDTPRIEAILKMLNIGAGIPTEDYAQKIDLISRAAESDPQEFMDTIKEELNYTKMEVLQAREMKVIAFDKKEVKFTEDKQVIMSLTKTAGEDQVEELTIYLLSKAGEQTHAEMVLRTDAAKKASV